MQRPGQPPIALHGLVEDPLVAEALQNAGYDARSMAGGILEWERAGHPVDVRLPDRAGGVDVVVVDLQLPDLPGAELTREIARMDPAPAIVVLTAHGERATALQALQAGASLRAHRAAASSGPHPGRRS